mgnify:CR=1 FL=1
MIVSAISLWKKLDMSNPLAESEWGEWTEGNAVFTNVTYSGHKAEDGSVRIYALFGKPAQGDKFPVILLLPDGGKAYDTELMLNGGSITGRFLSDDAKNAVSNALDALITPEAMEKRYGDKNLAPLLFAVQYDLSRC